MGGTKISHPMFFASGNVNDSYALVIADIVSLQVVPHKDRDE